MKTLLPSYFLTAMILVSGHLSAQSYLKGKTYNITTNSTTADIGFPNQCDECILNISNGVTFTIDKDVSIPNNIITGGTIILNKKMSFWGNGEFNGVTVIVNNNGSITSSDVITLKNSDFTFKGNSSVTFWSVANLNNTKMKFIDNSSLVATKNLNLTNNTSLVAGDGTTASNAFIYLNGGILTVYDLSYVTMMSTNNYYKNWDPYFAGGQSFITKNNKLNCDATGKNACSSALLYGPSTLNMAGISSSAVLPVKLSSFTAKLTGARVDLAWTTDMEINANRYEIERSTDGINWIAAGTVLSKGNSSVVTSYFFTDLLKVNGTTNYRLKMIDNDESFAYSPVKSVKAEAGIEMNIFPNPATDYVVVNTKSNSEKINVQLISQQGQLLRHTNGTGMVNLSLNEFKTGNYIVRVTTESGVAQSFKLIKH